MMTREQYIAAPTAASSLPYWKARSLSVPEGMLILREDSFSGVPEGFSDEPYFKMTHRMEGVTRPSVPKGFSVTPVSFEALSKHIAACYDLERADADELENTGGGLLDKEGLVIALSDLETGGIAASGFAEVDPSIDEGILDWVQVTPGYRRRGLGGFIVRELLFRMSFSARFAVVSGRVNSPSCPYKLYESCGFEAPVIWHVLKKRRLYEPVL